MYQDLCPIWLNKCRAMPKIVDHQQMRERIAAMASRLIAQNGLERTSMRSLAKASDCTTGMITHYFPYKNAILVAAIDYVASNQLSRIEAAAIAAPHDLFKIFSTNLPINEDDGIAMQVWLALWSMSTVNVELAAVQRRIHNDYLKLYSKILAGSGVIDDKSDAIAWSERILTVVNGLSIQALQAPMQWPEDRLKHELALFVNQMFGDEVKS